MDIQYIVSIALSIHNLRIYCNILFCKVVFIYFPNSAIVGYISYAYKNDMIVHSTKIAAKFPLNYPLQS